MTNPAGLAEFLDRYGIRSIRVNADTDLREIDASRLLVHFAAGGDGPEHTVGFKLLDRAADTHRYLRLIGGPPDCPLQLTPAGQALNEEERAAVIRALLDAIGQRVARIHREHAILNIRPVGKTFELQSGTRFRVLADDGEGRLAIELQRGRESGQAALAAADLLDGLYTGLITEA